MLGSHEGEDQGRLAEISFFSMCVLCLLESDDSVFGPKRELSFYPLWSTVVFGLFALRLLLFFESFWNGVVAAAYCFKYVIGKGFFA